MRIYLACTVRGERSGVLAGRAICERLQQLGHEVLTTHLLREDVDRVEAELTEEQVYRRDLDWLSCCDVLVAEASGSSYGVGFEVGYVIGRARATGQRAKAAGPSSRVALILLHASAFRPRSVNNLIIPGCQCATRASAFAR